MTSNAIVSFDFFWVLLMQVHFYTLFSIFNANESFNSF